MIARAINYILTLTPLGRYLNDKKIYISTGLIVLAAVLDFIEALARIFPQYAPLVIASKEVSEFLVSVADTLESVGLGGLVVGVTHRVAKARLAKAAK